MHAFRTFFGLARIALGWIFFWAFIDRLFGITGGAWIDGVSPTKGFLANATKGPFVDFHHAIAGHPVTDWLYMLGLGLVGFCLIVGIGLRVAGFSGAVMMVLFYSAVLPPEHNPVVDDHIVYALLLLAVAAAPDVADALSFGKRWRASAIVRRLPWTA